MPRQSDVLPTEPPQEEYIFHLQNTFKKWFENQYWYYIFEFHLSSTPGIPGHQLVWHKVIMYFIHRDQGNMLSSAFWLVLGLPVTCGVGIFSDSILQ
jgi:hypothetical protein